MNTCTMTIQSESIHFDLILFIKVCMFCYCLVGSLHAASATSKLATIVSFARVFNADPERVARHIVTALATLMALVTGRACQSFKNNFWPIIQPLSQNGSTQNTYW